MTRVVLPIGAMGLAACAADPATAFDVDVTVDDAGVVVSLDYVDPPCEPEPRFPQAGECVQGSDRFTCTRERTTCMTRARVERAGAPLAETIVDESSWSGFRIDAPGIVDAPGAELVLDGCGGLARIPLPARPAPPIVVGDITTDGTTVAATWTSDGTPSGTYAGLSYTFGGEACHEAAPGRARVPAPTSASAPEFWVASLIDDGAYDTPWGVARAWGITWNAPRDIIIPVRANTEEPEWLLGVALDQFSLPAFDVTGGVVLGVTLGATQRVGLYGPLFAYRAGDTTDTLRVATINAWYAATFPHVTPTNDLDFADDGDRQFALATGPIVLANEADPTDTRTTSLTVAFDHDYIVRPIP